MKDVVIEIIATILAYIAVYLFLARVISWCLTPFLVTFGLPTLSTSAILCLMVAMFLFKGATNRNC